MALQTVLPKDLAEVPVDRVIEARRRLLPELMRYREFLDALTPDFVEISASLARAAAGIVTQPSTTGDHAHRPATLWAKRPEAVRRRR
jgi:hypothetical protein